MAQFETEPAALRDPGEQPRPGHARLRLLPREPAARALQAGGRAAGDRLQDEPRARRLASSAPGSSAPSPLRARPGWMGIEGVNPVVPPLLVAMGPQREAPDRLIARLAQRQHRVVGRRQLLDAGPGAGMIRHRLECGRLFRLHPGVYSVGTADPGPLGHLLSAVFASGEPRVPESQIGRSPVESSSKPNRDRSKSPCPARQQSSAAPSTGTPPATSHPPRPPPASASRARPSSAS